MLKNDVSWPNYRQYRSGTEYEIAEFFSESLRNSCTFDFFLGFFSSSAINLLADSFATFIRNGGRMRLIINNILSQEDKEAIIKGTQTKVGDFIDIENLGELRDTLSKRDKHFFECLSWLISNQRIEIKIVKPKGTSGISHSKEGMFYDGNDLVHFSGSCNFSRTAIIENMETISIDCGWDAGPSQSRIEKAKRDFELTFGGGDPTVEYLDSRDITTNICTLFPTTGLVDLLQQEKEILDENLESPLNERVKKVLQRARNLTDETIRQEYDKIETPHFPYYEGPREYQKEAFEKWKANGQKGLFAMATGTGKTITALNCLLNIYKSNHYYKAIILVPTITLVEQWEEECKKFKFNHIIKVCSKYSDWKTEIARYRMLEISSTDKTSSYIIIATYASFVKSNIFSELNKFPKNKLLLIADEAHNMGSGLLLQRLEDIHYLRRIGLSATPKRQYDETGTQIIMNFFGCEESYTYEYTMEDAIENQALCRYYYYPHIVKLTDDEMADYIELTKKIVKVMNFQDNDSRDILKRLLLKRKRIIHKAKNKKQIFQSIIKEHLVRKGSLQFTLIYVPEGNKPEFEETEPWRDGIFRIKNCEKHSDVFDKKDTIDDDKDSQHLIDEYTRIVRDADSHVTVRQFTSDSTDRQSMIDGFASGEIHVLTSMKCLDEGVDVPRSETAIFCSSTGNPRQFIQRRGRVLRRANGKSKAIIHDLIVIPNNSFDEDCYELERALVEAELKRVRDFALLSENLNDTVRELSPTLCHYNLSIFNS